MIVQRHHSDIPFPQASATPALKPAQIAEQSSEEISLVDLLLLLGAYRRVILAFTIGFGILGLAAAFIVRPSYTAQTVILPPQQHATLAANMISEITNLGAMNGLASSGLGLKNSTDLYKDLLKSDTIADGLIKKFDLQREYKARYLSSARKALAAHTDIKSETKSTLISISFTDHDPRRAAAIANAYVAQYQLLSQHLAITEAGQRRVFFQREMLQAKNNLAKSEEALVQTEQKTGLVSLDSQERAEIESAAMLSAQITAKQAEIQSMEAFATPQNPQLIEAQRSLASLQGQLDKMGGGGITIGSQFVVPQAKIPREGMEYVRRLRDVKYYTTIFDILARQYESAKLDEAREGELIQVVDPALVPDRRSSPKRLIWTIIALVIGLFVGILTSLMLGGVHQMRLDPEMDNKLHTLRRLWLTRRPSQTPPI